MGNKKLFGLFNMVDIVLILIILIGIGFAGVKVLGRKADKNVAGEVSNKETYIEFTCEDANDFVVGHTKEGDHLKDALQSIDLGEIVEVEYGPARVYEPNDAGITTMSGKEKYVSVRVKARTNGRLTRDGLVVNSYNYYVGKSMEIRAGNAAFYAKVSNIEEKDKNVDDTNKVEENVENVEETK